ncbi:MAG: excinuclease ABC subunit UvrB [Candidatus Dojkabacteria bacterium]
MNRFQLTSKFKMSPPQQEVVSTLSNGIEAGLDHQTLIGVTGSGKTFAMANIIEQTQRPALILAHNKTLAAQLYSEFKEFFPKNAVRYFVSYYDYYQPEAYVPRRDLYIEKEADINETIEHYRSATTQAVLSRADTLVVASVSCIYGLGNPDDYMSLSREVKTGMKYSRSKFLRHLTDMQYERSEYDFFPGLFRVRGDSVDIYMSDGETALRVEYFGDDIESLKIVNPVTGELIESPDEYMIFPAKQFVTPYESLKAVIPQIEEDLKKETASFKKRGKILEMHRLEQRVRYDIEMLQETGYTSGIENYSRYIDRRKPGTPPSTLLDYFPEEWLIFVDESHMTLPQVRGMYNGDQARKKTLVEYGFRLKAAIDNRPLKYEEFNQRLDKAIYVSATPNDFELDLSRKAAAKLSIKYKDKLPKGYRGYAEQLIRPTGLLDPKIEIRPLDSASKSKLDKDLKRHGFEDMILSEDQPLKNQVDDLIGEIRLTVDRGQRVLVTTLTKRMAEDLSSYLKEIGVKVTYIHSDIDTVQRVELLKDLRLGKYDVLVGINLLREGLDLPEVSLVAILDADKEGFLRSRTSLIQTIGRASRHEEGRVLMYADHITNSMKAAVTETMRRRKVQNQYNKDHNITPKSIQKEIKDLLETQRGDKPDPKKDKSLSLFKAAESFPAMKKGEQNQLIEEIEMQMNIYADMLEFEKAADLRDLLAELKK